MIDELMSGGASGLCDMWSRLMFNYEIDQGFFNCVHEMALQLINNMRLRLQLRSLCKLLTFTPELSQPVFWLVKYAEMLRTNTLPLSVAGTKSNGADQSKRFSNPHKKVNEHTQTAVE